MNVLTYRANKKQRMCKRKETECVTEKKLNVLHTEVEMCNL